MKMSSLSDCFGSSIASILSSTFNNNNDDDDETSNSSSKSHLITHSNFNLSSPITPNHSYSSHPSLNSFNQSSSICRCHRSNSINSELSINEEKIGGRSTDKLLIEELDPILLTIEQTIDGLSNQLREFSLKMFDYAELAMQEFKTHDLLAEFMEKQIGWKVERHAYGLQTAVKATFKYGQGGRTVGFNSEMDALPKIGHACGHPLICISGIAAAIATAAALEKSQTPGTVILLGTPAEETIGGKIILIQRGAYKSMDACLMLHPAPYGGLLEMLAIAQIKVEYFGKNAHAAGAPWEGINALDAAVAAYNNISLLRQQIQPDQRVHGIILPSNDWASNIIPDYSSLRFDIRSKTKKSMNELKERVIKCFEAASISSGCSIKITEEMIYDDLINNEILGLEYKKNMEIRYGIEVPLSGPILGSTDFGNVSYEVPSIHPIFKIPTQKGGGNHTKGFEKSSQTERSHQLSLISSKSIGLTAFKVLNDLSFYQSVLKSFHKQKLTID